VLDLSEDPRRHIIQGPLVGRIFGVSAVAIRRSFRIVEPFSFCCASISPSSLAVTRPGEGCFLTEQHDVERIPVFRARARYEAEVERKDRADGENLVK